MENRPKKANLLRHKKIAARYSLCFLPQVIWLGQFFNFTIIVIKRKQMKVFIGSFRILNYNQL